MSTTLNRQATPVISSASPPSLGTLARVVLRLHRGALVTWLAVVVLVAVGLVWLRSVGVSATPDCWGQPGCLPGDRGVNPGLMLHLEWSVRTVPLLLSALPVAVAAWAGAALTGAEQERGTVAFAWTQSVSPRRWIAVKWSVAGALLVAGVGLLVPLYVWARSLPYMTESPMNDWTVWLLSSAPGPATPALYLLALTLGAYTGLLLRRSLAALAVSAVAMFGVVKGLPPLIPHLWPAERILGWERGAAPAKAWVVSEEAVDAQGRAVSMDGCYRESDALVRQCVEAKGGVGFETVHHPVSHALPLHLAETALLLVLTAVLAFAALRLLRRRTA
ncbi:ABC transporter [Streptomyces sp. SID8014]|uniref:ABC transporter n=1 Tax=Streptomyces sp. SID8014 TaxID=2706097 RepID=UPI0013BE031F|nr:ABC transporter [Streptomyces sp. SID8014]NEC12708.1 ABC transporter [Streptomyces sp. SID8014]